MYIKAAILLRNGRIIKDDVVIFRSAEKGVLFLNEAYERLAVNYPRFYKMDTLSKMGTVAAAVLLKDSFDPAARQPDEAGIVLSNRNASIEADAQYWEASQEYPSPALFVYTLPNIVIGELSIRYQFKGENAFFVSEAFDAEWLHWYVTDLMTRNLLKTCMCGWLDVFDDQLDACLFLVESDTSETGSTFTAENLKSIYNKNYGK
ncbi:hypothetical protein A8C56_19630 [Niabella ginsenosidivorans]|uniref:3-oxoacyl-ACP synthase n=1 Tax=Niabella ginsenosidivorans TaxID=1176587 RepID=A0A1A9I929_9BACT|nr:hypothetical protein A8C56_19630 [Niabella ginsenosidivorans]